MARHATQAGLRFWSVDLFLDRAIEASIEEHCMIVAARAPFARFRPHHRLHVLNRFPVELVVERSEMMSRALPLLVDVAVTFAALLRFHEEGRRHKPPIRGVRA